jgi:hypothetical protein
MRPDLMDHFPPSRSGLSVAHHLRNRRSAGAAFCFLGLLQILGAEMLHGQSSPMWEQDREPLSTPLAFRSGGAAAAVFPRDVTLEPGFVASRDSDGINLLRSGIKVSLARSGPIQYGLQAARITASDQASSSSAEQVSAFAEARRTRLRLSGELGLLRTEADRPVDPTPVGALRLRWHSPESPWGGELRLRRTSLLASPSLIREPVTLEDARMRLDFPLGRSTSIRTSGRAGILTSSDAEENVRTGFSVGPVWRIGGGVESFVQYSQLGNRHPSQAGYFSPRSIQAVEFGTYAEFYPGDLTIILDAGLGPERITPHEGVRGGWKRASRVWGSVQMPILGALSIGVELDFYDTRLGAARSGEGEQWWQAGAATYLAWALP